jgi:hypothetical protein
VFAPKVCESDAPLADAPEAIVTESPGFIAIDAIAAGDDVPALLLAV